jgi:hypothetical protein
MLNSLMLNGASAKYTSISVSTLCVLDGKSIGSEFSGCTINKTNAS